MQGHEMYWELNLLYLVPHTGCRTFFEWTVKSITTGDHSPEFRFELMVMNFMIIDFAIHNIYHALIPPEDTAIIGQINDILNTPMK